MKTYMGGARSARTSILLVAFTTALAFSGACSSKDDNPTPNTGGKAQGGARTTGGSAGNGTGGIATSGGTGTSGGSAGASETGGTDVGGEPGTGGTAGATDGGGGGAGGAGSDNNCPATDLEFLNRPNDSQCSKFPNTKARLPLLNADGSLPPLPG